MASHDEFIKYPTGKINKGEFCDCCKRYNARYMTCSIIPVKGDEVLMIKRGHEPMKGSWAFPGGYLDWDETLGECAARELKEESGYTAKKVEFFGCYSDPKRDPDDRQNVDHCFIAEIEGKQGSFDKNEIAEVKWFPMDKLPENIAFDHRQMFEDYLKKKKSK